MRLPERLQGAYDSWTAAFSHRITAALTESRVPVQINSSSRGDSVSRIRFLPRVKGASKFLLLLAAADVVLHPFPFDGAKTAVDAVALAVPAVAMRSEFLRGRMAAALYDTMRVGGLVALDVPQYVAIARELGTNHAMNDRASSLIAARRAVVWNDALVVDDWGRFLSRAVRSAVAAASGEPQRPLPNELQTGCPSGGCRTGSDDFPGWALVHPFDPAASFLPSAHKTSSFAVAWDYPIPPLQRTLPLSQFAATATAGEQQLTRDLHIHYAEGNFVGAEIAAGALVALRPALASLRNDLGAVMKQQWRLEEAQVEFEVSLMLSPQYVEATNNLGVLLMGMGEFDKAAVLLRRALDLDPSYLNALYNLVNLFRDAKKQPAQVLELILIWLRLFPPAGLSSTSGYAAEGGLAVAEGIGGGAHVRVSDCGVQALAALASCDILDAPRDSIAAAFAGAGCALPLGHTELLVDAAVRLRAPDAHGMADALAAAVFGGTSTGSTPVELTKTIDAARFLRRIAPQFASRGSAGARPLPASLDSPGAEACASAPSSKIALIVQYFHSASHDFSRQAELDETLSRNLANPCFTGGIHVLTERWLDLGAFAGDPPRAASPLKQHVIGERLTFAVAFHYAATHLDGAIVVLANADIVFDETLCSVARRQDGLNGTVLALLRWEGLENLLPRTSQQDAWLFLSPLPMPLAAQPWRPRDEPVAGVLGGTGSNPADFELGRLRCDNRVARILVDAGLRVLNPALTIRATHIQRSRARGYSEHGQVGGDGLFVPISLEGPPFDGTLCAGG